MCSLTGSFIDSVGLGFGFRELDVEVVGEFGGAVFRRGIECKSVRVLRCPGVGEGGVTLFIFSPEYERKEGVSVPGCEHCCNTSKGTRRSAVPVVRDDVATVVAVVLWLVEPILDVNHDLLVLEIGVREHHQGIFREESTFVDGRNDCAKLDAQDCHDVVHECTECTVHIIQFLLEVMSERFFCILGLVENSDDTDTPVQPNEDDNKSIAIALFLDIGYVVSGMTKS